MQKVYIIGIYFANCGFLASRSNKVRSTTLWNATLLRGESSPIPHPTNTAPRWPDGQMVHGDRCTKNRPQQAGFMGDFFEVSRSLQARNLKLVGDVLQRFGVAGHQ